MSISMKPFLALDAELIAVCAEFDVCENQSSIINGTGPDSIKDDGDAAAASAPIHDRMNALLDRMHDLRATTPDGIQARAHSLALHAGHGAYSFDYDDTIPGRLLNYLMRDAAALGASGIVVQVASPDVALVAACAEFDAFEQRCNSLYYDATRIEDDAERDEAIAPIRVASQPSLERVCGLPARTLAGLQARARTILIENLDLDPAVDAMEGAYTNERLVAALLRDLLAMGAALSTCGSQSGY